MSVTTTQSGRNYQLLKGLFVLGCSIMLPAIVIVCSFIYAFEGKPFGRSSGDVKFYYSDIHDGELWYSVWQEDCSAVFVKPKTPGCRIKRLDLKTGVEVDSGIETGTFLSPLWIGDRLYLNSSKSIYEMIDNTPVLIGPMISHSAPFSVNEFEMDGRITTVRSNPDGTFCLAHLVDGEWIDGRRIRIPEGTRVWRDVAGNPRKALFVEPAMWTGSPLGWRLLMKVVKHDENFHLLISDLHEFSAYRTGFDFATDEDPSTLSALAPETASHEAVGWEQIDDQSRLESFDRFVADKQGLLFSSRWPFNRIVRRHSDGRWEVPAGNGNTSPSTISGMRGRLGGNYGVVVTVDTSNQCAYAIYWNDSWNSAKICRIEGTKIRDPDIVIPGCYSEYLNRWKWFGTGLLLAWIAHLGVIGEGFAWLARGRNTDAYQFGAQQVVLASFRKRASAAVIDFFVFAGLMTVMILIARTISFPDSQNLAETLMDVEMTLFHHFTHRSPLIYIFDNLSESQVLTTLHDILENVGLIMAALLVVSIPKIYCEGRYGTSPGKWLLGLRTVRATLRPCGFARALVRSVFYCVDMPFLLSPIPSAFSMFFSERRQRLGDRVTDTIVIRD